MLKLHDKSRFRKDYKKLKSSGKQHSKLADVVDMLQKQEALPERYRDHLLTGNYSSHRECHIESDWLLIYKVEGEFLILVRTGSHSELFG
jgi:mRNA interferase YafQ